ncbi:MAG: NAD(P)-dependent glycerol-3-phosphate dehydrogenase [Firmicutes bacterium]|nr:NAD(P)-dependent glycerol-3-phosphate dehydrogenase [Bacillota bacterium]
MKVAVLGGGSWGVSIANVLNDNKNEVSLYFRDQSQIDHIKEHGKSDKYLKDFTFPKDIRLSSDIYDAIKDSEVIVLATPLQVIEDILIKIKPYIDSNNQVILVNASKGIHFKRLKTASDIVKDILGDVRFVALSGPSHAEEVSKRLNTTVVSASLNEEVACIIQDLFMNDYFRVYVHNDVLGVEMASALKNVIAIGAGILTGLEQGDNAKAALITRGLFEISKLGKAFGCSMYTFMGLAGMGDLIATANSVHSRNFRAGLLIGKGVAIKDVSANIGETVEGMVTAKAAYTLSKQYHVSMPITKEIYEVLYEDKDPKEAIFELMTRPKKHEFMEVMEI